MRYDAEHKDKTREKVLKEASRALRAEGPHKMAVSGVMAKAGLTHGGFYAHFASKDELIAAAIEAMFNKGARGFTRMGEGKTPAQRLAGYVDFYLSDLHRSTRIAGCPLPALAPDIPRLTPKARERFDAGVSALTARLTSTLAEMGDPDPVGSATALLAELVGAQSLARAVSDQDLSDAILARTKTAITQRYNLEPVL